MAKEAGGTPLWVDMVAFEPQSLVPLGFYSSAHYLPEYGQVQGFLEANSLLHFLNITKPKRQLSQAWVWHKDYCRKDDHQQPNLTLFCHVSPRVNNVKNMEFLDASFVIWRP